MLFLLGLILIIFTSYNSKNNKVLYLLSCIFCVLIIGFNYDNPDYYNYEVRYNAADFPQEFNIFHVLDIGYTLIQACCKELGIFEFQKFRMVLAILIMAIYGITIFKYCKYYSLFMAYYILFYLPLDQIQIRGFLAFVTFLPFFLNFIKKRSTQAIILYFLGILISFTIHFSAIFFLVFCILWFKSKKVKFIFSVICLLAFMLTGYVSSELAMLDHISDYDKPTVIGAFAGCSLLIINYFFIKVIFDHYVNNRKNKKLNIFKKTKMIEMDSNIIIQVNLLMLLFIPLLFFNATILRIFRYVTIVNVIYLLNVLSLCDLIHKKNNIRLLILIYLVFIFLRIYQPSVLPSVFNNLLMI